MIITAAILLLLIAWAVVGLLRVAEAGLRYGIRYEAKKIERMKR